MLPLTALTFSQSSWKLWWKSRRHRYTGIRVEMTFLSSIKLEKKNKIKQQHWARQHQPSALRTTCSYKPGLCCVLQIPQVLLWSSLRLCGFNFSWFDGSEVPKDLGTGPGMLNSVSAPFLLYFSAKSSCFWICFNCKMKIFMTLTWLYRFKCLIGWYTLPGAQQRDWLMVNSGNLPLSISSLELCKLLSKSHREARLGGVRSSHWNRMGLPWFSISWVRGE